MFELTLIHQTYVINRNYLENILVISIITNLIHQISVGYCTSRDLSLVNVFYVTIPFTFAQYLYIVYGKVLYLLLKQNDTSCVQISLMPMHNCFYPLLKCTPCILFDITMQGTLMACFLTLQIK